jgi:hypothetical protein
VKLLRTLIDKDTYDKENAKLYVFCLKVLRYYIDGSGENEKDKEDDTYVRGVRLR